MAAGAVEAVAGRIGQALDGSAPLPSSRAGFHQALPGLPNPLPAVLGAGAVGAGCAGVGDAGRLEAFAEAGIAYADKAPTLMDQSFEAAVAVDSGALLEERSRLSEPQRREALEKFDEAMEERRAGYAAASEPARLEEPLINSGSRRFSL